MDTILQSGIVSASLQVVVDRFATFAFKKICLLLGVDNDLEKLNRTLLKIQALLDNEEMFLMNKLGQVWLQDLQKASYDAEDLVDEISLGLLRLNLDDSSTRNNKNQVRNMVVSSFNFSVPHEISKMQQKLEEIVTQMDSFFMGEAVKHKLMRPHCPTSSLIDEWSVIGRDNDKNAVIQMLLSEESGVIPILGMGGVGKTTLAQIVYNDERVVSWFELRIWVHVSVEFDVTRITRSILESVVGKNCKLSDLDPLQVRLQNVVKGKKFLLVLDDTWNENFSDWDVLLSPFRVGSIGSKILVTTRSRMVSSIIGTTTPYSLQGLSDEDCWALIKQRALANRGLNEHRDLDEYRNLIGEEIARKCKGLPLAAKTLGSVLHFKYEEEEWEGILKSELWDLPEDKNEIFSALRLSYHHLPAHLKKCFAYCSIFPQNFEFKKDYLVQLWMAEGFIQPKGRRRMEDIGNDYFDNLLWRSFFQDSRANIHDPSIYKMHDLIHNLAQLVSVDICFRKEDDRSHSYPMLRNARHSSLLRGNIQQMNLEAFLDQNESLRTFLLFGHRTRIGQVHCKFFLKLRRLRVLDLSYTGIVDLPDSIDNLKHLRYLNVSGTLIRKLPESSANLCGLKTLKLKDCEKFLQLPRHMSNLTSLRHLHLDKNSQLSSMPSDLGKLSRLQTLHAFIVGSDRRCRIRELKDMKDLRGSISITKLENVENVTEAKEAMLDKKPNLDKIELQWDKSGDGTVEGEVLAGLKPHENLKELHIIGYVGFLFPTWLGDPSFRKLESLYLQDCKCELLPPLGQLPLLKYLYIEEMSGLKIVDHFFCGAGLVESFPSLELLEFRNLPKLDEWNGLNTNDMPHLHQLKIVDCPELIFLPSLHYLTSLEHLEISCCPILQSLPAEGLPISVQTLIINESSILQERCRVGEGEDWWMIRPILTLEIDFVEIPMQGRGD